MAISNKPPTWLDLLLFGLHDFYVNGVEAPGENGLNFIAGAGMGIAFVDNPTEARTDVTFTVGGATVGGYTSAQKATGGQSITLSGSSPFILSKPGSGSPAANSIHFTSAAAAGNCCTVRFDASISNTLTTTLTSAKVGALIEIPQSLGNYTSSLVCGAAYANQGYTWVLDADSNWSVPQ